MTGKRREPSQIARDRRRMAELYLQGWLQADIGKELGLAQPTVSRDLKALQREWLNSALLDFNEAKARELAKIDHLEREYWQSWQDSKQRKSRTTRGRGTKEGGQVVEQVVKTEEHPGDPRYLSGVQWCIEQRCKIMGVYAPVKTDVTTAGEPLAVVFQGS